MTIIGIANIIIGFYLYWLGVVTETENFISAFLGKILPIVFGTVLLALGIFNLSKV